MITRKSTAFLACLILAAGPLQNTVSAADKPNILFIVGDDMGFADVGFNHCQDIPTPNLDSLAKSGVRFTSGYVSAPYCSPCRAGLMTGRYQEKFGHEFNPTGRGTGLPLTEKTIADRLKSAGYVTGLAGKWHLGNIPEMHPQKRGFDEFFGFLGGSHSYFKWDGMLRGTEPARGTEYFTDAFGGEACEFIEKHKGHPWFLYLAFNAVHTPMHATDERLAKFTAITNKQRQTYDAMMLALDENIGRVRRKLAETGQENNTFIIFISDNGGPTMPGTTINGSRNDPFRGSKRTTLEGGIRVPFLVSWKDHVLPGVYDQPVIQLDLTATALAIAGVAASNLDGVNLLPFLAGEKKSAPHDALYWRFGKQMAIRAGEFKLVRYDSNADGRTGKPNQPIAGPRLYNVVADPGEARDLYSELPEKAREMQARWDAWNATLMKPLWEYGKSDSDGDPGETRKKKKRA
jgi:arylsulfatase A-like enzyme